MIILQYQTFNDFAIICVVLRQIIDLPRKGRESESQTNRRHLLRGWRDADMTAAVTPDDVKKLSRPTEGLSATDEMIK